MKDRLRILVIDDSVAQLDSVAHALGSEGHEVLTASGIEQAQGLVVGCDLVIVDYHMPDAPGDQILGKLRRVVPACARVLFYLYTSDPEVAATYKPLGFDGAFTRKGSVEELISQVRTTSKILQMRRFMQSTQKY